MTKKDNDDTPGRPDLNENAARIVRESTSEQNQSLPHDLEAAWQEWSRGLRRVNERTMTLLRSAFEAGYAAGAASSKVG